MSKNIFAAGLGIATTDSKNNVIEVFFAKSFLQTEKNHDAVSDFVKICSEIFSYDGGNSTFSISEMNIDHLIEIFDGHSGTISFLDTVRSAQSRAYITILEKDEAPKDIFESYLKLSLLSSRAVKPNCLDLDGIFANLPNLVWTSQGAMTLEDYSEHQLAARVQGINLEVYSVDKFPKMLNHIVPSGVRVGDASRIRLGAHLGDGTTVMHEGFVNFNAGTLGKGMIEGRISAGVVVGDGSDLGGGCSTMGTLSGGNNIRISVGENCLIGANAGVGIPLGDNCIIEAGLYITAGSKVTYLGDDNFPTVMKASELTGVSDLLFRRNSQSGAIEVIKKVNEVTLNEELHKN